LEVDVVVGPTFLLTHHDRPSRSVDAVMERLGKSPELLAKGPAFLAHAIVDRLVDKYLPLMGRFGDAIDRLELEILDGATPDVLERIFDLKRALAIIRRIGPHQRDLLQRLSHNPLPRIPDETRPFFRDVYDHFLSAAGLAEAHRELLGGTLDGYVSVQSHRLNEVMKVLTLISTVMLPLTFVTGLYGMNFEVMPELAWRWGYLFAWGAMVTIAGSFFFFFKKKGWL
jgi:magnesium transporter